MGCEPIQGFFQIGIILAGDTQHLLRRGGQGIQIPNYQVRLYARRAGFRELYLYSACRDFYERFGWRYIGEGLDYPATAVHLYRYDLSPSCGATTE